MEKEFFIGEGKKTNPKRIKLFFCYVIDMVMVMCGVRKGYQKEKKNRMDTIDENGGSDKKKKVAMSRYIQPAESFTMN